MGWINTWILGMLSTVLFAAIPAQPRTEPQIENSCRATFVRYFHSAVQGLDSLRGTRGLVRDTVLVDLKDQTLPYHEYFAPTDVGLDLMVQLGRWSIADKASPEREAAVNAITATLSTLETLERHAESGLFLRLYNDTNGAPRDRDVSSIDNLHLALGLWTLSKQWITEHPQLAKSAATLVEGMDFSSFFDPTTESVGGNLAYQPIDGRYVLDAYRFEIGSEARSLFSVGYALGLFRNIADEKLLSALQRAPLELTSDRKTFRVWDGGVFQSLLPTLLTGSQSLSDLENSNLNEVFLRVFSPKAIFPRALSASVTHVDLEKKIVRYSGKIGIKELKRTLNVDVLSEGVVVPHALFLAAMATPCEALPAIEKLEKDLYSAQTGWWVSGEVRNTENNSPLLSANRALVGVDKGIEALALLTLLDENHRSPSAQMLHQDPEIKKRLVNVLEIVDKRRNETE
ncbi:MAG: hypothetical protein R3B54_01890 [Bdellovibrionota bacterium]